MKVSIRGPFVTVYRTLCFSLPSILFKGGVFLISATDRLVRDSNDNNYRTKKGPLTSHSCTFGLEREPEGPHRFYTSLLVTWVSSWGSGTARLRDSFPLTTKIPKVYMGSPDRDQLVWCVILSFQESTLNTDLNLSEARRG